MLKIADPFLKSVLEMMDGKTMRGVKRAGEHDVCARHGTELVG
jgi:hypothetical protein